MSSRSDSRSVASSSPLVDSRIERTVSFGHSEPRYRFNTSGRPSSARTPGSAVSSARGIRSYVICAVAEGKGPRKGEVAMAAMDLRYSDVELFDFMDGCAYTRLRAKLRLADPVEILMPESFGEKACSVLLREVISNVLPGVPITNVHKRFFNSFRGVELCKTLQVDEVSNVDQVVMSKELLMSCAAALLKYVEHVQNTLFATHSLRLTYRDVVKSCVIDVSSWRNLEIVNDDEKRADRRSLLTMMDNTLTQGGARALRRALLQPSTQRDEIEARLDAVEEMVDDSHMLERVRSVLCRVHDMDHAMSVCVRQPIQPTQAVAEGEIVQMLRLQQTLSMVEPLVTALTQAQASVLIRCREYMRDDRLTACANILDEYFDPSVLHTQKKNSITIRNQKCFAVREGKSLMLDLARRTYEELIKDAQEKGDAELADHFTNNENVRVAFSVQRGFHYLLVTPHAATIPLSHYFVNSIRNKSSITFTSRNMVRYNDRIDYTVKSILMSSLEVVREACLELRPFIASLHHVVDAIATIDLCSTLALYATRTSCTRPRFDNKVVVKEGRHPLLDSHCPEKTVPNDTYMTRDARIAMVTGPNMAGKSTYLKQICQLAVMSQAGCLVPATIVIMPIFDKMFSRVGHNDSLAESLSAFALEMRDAALILEHADCNTLVIVDELARSTSTEEGIGMSYAIIEQLIKQKAFVVFATHFLDLATMDVSYSCVENYHFAAQVEETEDGDEVMHAAHKLLKGPYKGPLYAFELVQLSTLPEKVHNEAKELAKRLRVETEGRRRMDIETADKRARLRISFRLTASIHLLKGGQMGTNAQFLDDLRQNFEAMRAEGSEREEAPPPVEEQQTEEVKEEEEEEQESQGEEQMEQGGDE